MTLTKTDFKKYLICPKWIWVKKKKPELYVQGETSLFLEKLINDGYEVESFAQKLFPEGVELTGSTESLVADTQHNLSKDQTMFQATFQTDRGLFVKVDVLVFNKETKKWDIFEIKASSSIKTDLQHNHLKDITFQTITAIESGVDIGKSYIIHINKEYIRNGEINIQELFVIEDVTQDVQNLKESVSVEIDEALELLNEDDISLDGCDCLYKSHGQRCDSFKLFNTRVPAYSVHHIVSGKKLQSLLADHILDVKDIPNDFELTHNQQVKVDIQKSGKPLIDTESINESLSSLTYPLYFLDYETFGKPYPILDGYKTNQQIVFQYSLHVIDEDGKVEHFEYLGNDFETAAIGLVESLKENIGPVGSVIVWNEGFEKGRNKELGIIHPEYNDFLVDVNSRIYDLMLIFKKDYMHPASFGSASIKKVLPVMVPELSYKDLDVQDGTMAMSEWERSVSPDLSQETKEEIRANLLKYCELDTLAMVEIYKKLKELL